MQNQKPWRFVKVDLNWMCRARSFGLEAFLHDILDLVLRWCVPIVLHSGGFWVSSTTKVGFRISSNISAKGRRENLASIPDRWWLKALGGHRADATQ